MRTITTLAISALAEASAPYGIESFDPRDSRQVRAAVSVISSKICRKESLTDALEFIESLSTRYIDPSAVISRVLTLCVTYNNFNDESNSIDTLVRDIMMKIPQTRLNIVIEDTISCLLYELEEFCNISLTNGTPGTIHNEEDKFVAMTICRGVILVSSIFLDIKRGVKQGRSNISSIDDCHKGDTISSWVNSEFLMCFKRLRTLQSDFNLYLSFEALVLYASLFGLVVELVLMQITLSTLFS